ncbi:MAG: cobalt-precorrin-6A reductase, partial [Rhodospirillaceae bacterium]|nr:cobalt-precorrin-6A reductase [Rhodospirillaceae bacterium]
MSKNVLILGGTGEAIALATAFLEDRGDWQVISSLAGRVANPRLPPGEVRVGGFGGGAGLARFLKDRQIGALIDATHPFARRMGWNAAEAAALAGTPLLRLERPAWRAQAGDRWTEIDSWDEAVARLRGAGRRVFLALGRQELAPFTALADITFVIRSVEAPDPQLHFAQAEFIRARGPFQLEDERALLRAHEIDCIVCKNSGGGATDAKLTAARELGIEVIMQRRPPRPPVPQVDDVAAA